MANPLEKRRERVTRLDQGRTRITSQRHAEVQRAIIIRSARKLLEERGHISKVTVQELSVYCQMSVGGLYLYYPSMMTVWGLLLREDMKQLVLNGQSPTNALKRYIPIELWEMML